MAFERLQTRAPFISHRRQYCNQSGLLVPEEAFDYAMGRTEHERRRIRLEGTVLNSHFVVHDESMGVFNELK
jgi:hypothetical protein